MTYRLVWLFVLCRIICDQSQERIEMALKDKASCFTLHLSTKITNHPKVETNEKGAL
jgi:hypothetical protein